MLPLDSTLNVDLEDYMSALRTLALGTFCVAQTISLFLSKMLFDMNIVGLLFKKSTRSRTWFGLNVERLNRHRP